MSLKPTREQLPFYNLFTRHVSDDGVIHDSNFKHDIDTLRKTGNILQPIYENTTLLDDTVNFDEVPSLLAQFMMKYKLPQRMDDFIYHFIVSGKIDLSKLRNGVYTLDDNELLASGESDQEQNFKSYVADTEYTKYMYVRLAIPVSATITQINKTISTYQGFIKDRQIRVNGAPLQRVSKQREAVRDNKIIELSNTGKKPKEVARLMDGESSDPLTNYDIARIKRRKQK